MSNAFDNTGVAGFHEHQYPRLSLTGKIIDLRDLGYFDLTIFLLVSRRIQVASSPRACVSRSKRMGAESSSSVQERNCNISKYTAKAIEGQCNDIAENMSITLLQHAIADSLVLGTALCIIQYRTQFVRHSLHASRVPKFHNPYCNIYHTIVSPHFIWAAQRRRIDPLP